jgi:DNA repair exonuclease SbcCD ATPase subunit
MPTTTAPTLADRLVKAQRAEQPLRERVTGLEVELAQAVEARDYSRADRAQQDLGPAREQLAIAAAEVASLQQAAAAIDEQRAKDAQAIAEAQRQDQLRQQHAEVEARAKQFRAEARRRHEKIRAAIVEAREGIGSAIAAERAELGARAEARQLLEALGVIEPGGYHGRLSAPTEESIGGTDPLLTAIWRSERR